MEEEKNSCHNCVYMRNVPYDAHISCAFNFKKAGAKLPPGDRHAFEMGWYMFPVNYDPIWMIGGCTKFSKVADPEFETDPMSSFISMLR